MKNLVTALLLILTLAACDKQQQLKNEIAQLELEEAEASPEGKLALANAYYEYATKYPNDSVSEGYLFRSCGMFAIMEKHEELMKASSAFFAQYDQSPNFSRVQLQRAKSFFVSDMPDSAVVVYEQVRDRAALNGDDLHFLKKTYLKLVEKYPTEERSIDYRIKGSNLLAEAGSGEQAIALLLQVTDSFPESNYCPYALMRAADIAETRLADIPQAEQLLKRLIYTYPQSNFASDAQIILEKQLLGLTDEEKFQRIVSQQQAQ
ncbi:MAG: tetratricopeptide repeat protein [Flavobacteriales bacterium]|nr:tetratricopeptide repeat protein [Flavobacteriales bacterium]